MLLEKGGLCMKVKLFIEVVKKMLGDGGSDVSVRMNGHEGDPVAGIMADKDVVILVDPMDFKTCTRDGRNPVKADNGAEFLDALKSCDSDAVIKLNSQYGYEVLFAVMRMVKTGKHDNVLYLETEADANMKNEIRKRLMDAVVGGMDETDVYQEMLDTGIDPDMVRRYYDVESGDYMETYCKEHGLM